MSEWEHGLSDVYWYGRVGAVSRWFYGVFEGGGAKGIAYGGALLAMKMKHCWFRGVAGASAGAITAALIASGLTPEEIISLTDDALNQVRTGVWSGLKRLREGNGYFPSTPLLDWIERLLKKQVAQSFKEQVARAPFIASPDPVTFQDLYDATGIELNIIAADLSLKRQVIFSHFDTPECSVAAAVVASSSIPFAFGSRLLEVPSDTDNAEVFHHTIVDGGVWSNFPIFVFEDRFFRSFYKRDPIDPSRVIGFFLKERDEGAPPRGEKLRFVTLVRARKSNSAAKAYPLRPQENSLSEKWPTKSSNLWVRILECLLFPFAVLGRLAE